jgi:phospholipid/cholesterol/gamma-HCH transport system substrate-binding protein
MTRKAAVAAAAAAILLAAVGALLLRDTLEYRHASIYFERTDGLYAGDEVRVLGLTVGTIRAISPQPGGVRVDVTYRSSQPLPADAHAAIIAPTLVTARFIQIAPVYLGGPQLSDGATIPIERTAVPIEWDQIKQQLNRLSVALGPGGANRDGALNRFLDTAARNLSGQGENLGQTMTNLARATSALATGRNDLTGTIGHLQEFVTALAANDAQVRGFTGDLATASDFLASDREQLATTLRSLQQALGQVQDFVSQNKALLTGDLHTLTDVTQTLADEQSSLAALLQSVAPTLSDFYNIYDPVSRSMTGAPVLTYLQDPATYVCSMLAANGASPAQCQAALAPLLNLAAIDYPPVSLNPIVRPGVRPPADGPPHGLVDLLLPGGGK